MTSHKPNECKATNPLFYNNVITSVNTAIRQGTKQNMNGIDPVSILYKSIAGRYRPVRVADGPISARYRFIKNASWVAASSHRATKRINNTRTTTFEKSVVQSTGLVVDRDVDGVNRFFWYQMFALGSNCNNNNTFFFFFFFFFDLGFTTLSNIFHEPIVHRRWAKTGEPREKQPDHL